MPLYTIVSRNTVSVSGISAVNLMSICLFGESFFARFTYVPQGKDIVNVNGLETKILTNIFKNNGVDMKFITKIERQCIYHFPRMWYVLY